MAMLAGVLRITLVRSRPFSQLQTSAEAFETPLNAWTWPRPLFSGGKQEMGPGKGQADSGQREWAMISDGRAEGFTDDKRWAGRLWAEGFSGCRRWAGRLWAEGFSDYRQWAGQG